MKNVLFCDFGTGNGGSAKSLSRLLINFKEIKSFSCFLFKNKLVDDLNMKGLNSFVLFPEIEDKDKINNIVFSDGSYIEENKIRILNELKKIIKLNDINLVVVNTTTYYSYLIMMAAKSMKIPFFSMVRGVSNLGRRTKKFLKYTDEIICVSDYMVRWIKEQGFTKNIIKIYDGFEVEKFDVESDLREEFNLEKYEVGIVGSLIDVKNHKLFLESAKKVLEVKKDVTFLIIGDGPLQNQLEDYAKTLNILDNVLFLGRRDDIPNVMNGLDVLVLTSKSEAFPGVVIEAMLSGKPVIATKCGGAENIIDDKTGFLVDIDDSTFIADKLIFLLENKEIAKSMGKLGRRKASCLFDINIIIKKFNHLVESLR